MTARPGGVQRHTRQKVYSETDLNLDDVSINAKKTSNWVRAEGYNNFAISMEYTYGAGTNLQWYVEFSDNEDDPNDDAGAIVHKQMTKRFGQGTVTYYEATNVLEAPGANYDFTTERAPVTHKWMRIAFDMTGSPTTSDKIKARLILGVV